MSLEAEATPSVLSSFFTRPQANEGRVFPLVSPDGTETPYSLTVRSRHSDAVAQALENAQRKKLQNAMKPESERVSDRELNLPILVAMVSSWTLPDAFTPENVELLMQNAPQIAETVDRFSWTDTHFFGNK